MSSASQLTATSTSETKSEKHNSISNFLHLSSSPTTNSKYLYYVNAESAAPIESTHVRPKVTPLSLSVPWYKRTRSPTDEKTRQMSRDRLLPLNKLFSNTTQSTIDEDQISPTNDLTPLDESIKVNEKNLRQMKENGYLRNTSHLVTR